MDVLQIPDIIVSTKTDLRSVGERNSSLLLDSGIAQLPVALYTCDMEGHIQSFNKAAVELWGREPVAGKDMWCGSWKIYQPDGITLLPPENCPMAIALQEQRAVEGVEIVIERPDGIRRNIRPHPVPIYDNDGSMVGALNMLEDITEGKAFEKNVATLAAIVEYSNDAIISKTLDGIITSWNATAEKMYGYTAEEMIGQPIQKLIPPDRQDEEIVILDRLKRGEVVDHFETKRLTKDRRLLDLSLTISPIKDRQGKVIGASKIARDITEQKQYYRAMRESEERLSMAVEATRLGTWEFHPLTGKLNWSQECRKIYDVPEDMEVNFGFFSDHIHPEDISITQSAIQKAMDPLGSGNYDIEYRILRYSDRQTRWIRAQGKVYLNDAQLAERFIGTVLDITEVKSREQKLMDSVEMFTNMVNHLPAMIWMSGPDRKKDFFNNTWLEFTGKSLEEETNEGWLANVHPEDALLCRDNFNHALRLRVGFYTEYRLKRHDGQYRWIGDNSAPRYDADGTFVGFISACMDINDQKRFREKIQERELHFKTITNVSPVGLWMTDTNAQNIFVNDTWIEWTGIPFEKQLGTGWLEKVVEEDKLEAPAKFWECLLKRDKYTAVFRLLGPEGNIRWCLTEGSPYYDIDGEFSGYAGSVTDITELRQLEERKDDFIKMASHELKTPITSIKGYVQLLSNIYNELDDAKLLTSRPTVKSSLDVISKQVSKLTRLVSELLDLSKIESGRLELNQSSFELSRLVEEVVQDLQQTSSRHQIVLRTNFTGKIYADRDRIAQVISNLLTNAIKYSPSANKVEVSVGEDREMAVITVSDEGIGIDKKDHLRIFERFFRVEGKSELTFPGFGIGLFIAGEIVERHKGKISVQSEKDKGSIFTITLPVKAAFDPLSFQKGNQE